MSKIHVDSIEHKTSTSINGSCVMVLVCFFEPTFANACHVHCIVCAKNDYDFLIYISKTWDLVIKYTLRPVQFARPTSGTSEF